LIVGLVTLVMGADLLVRGATVLAAAARISPLVIGLTVVAFGTSAPEMAVSVVSSVRNEPQIALGNVLGSNIFNVLFVLGASALILPLVVSKQLIRIDIPLMIVASIAAIGFAWDGSINRVEGGVLFIALVVYTAMLVWLGRREANRVAEANADQQVTPGGGLLRNSFLTLLGLGLLVLGASWLVESSATIARSFGISELVIGVTIVAVGTSLPEVATSLMAAVKGQRDLAVGNVVGSNVFNLLAVLGISAIASPLGLPIASQALRFDFPVMVAVACVCLPIALTRSTVSRWEGGLLVICYGVYTSYLVLHAQQSGALDEFRFVALWAGLPIIVAVFVLLTWRERRRPSPTELASQ
jgi:cation:H+ antiporter